MPTGRDAHSREIDAPCRADAWLDKGSASERKIMGLGHRAHKREDSRVPIT
ncbi:hypothetical protein GCM10010331_77350 [Streptomyces xanthochromogenes]|nr:hypothetical protein GCM10010331_77350 [Streptomyces xanthochromogenes]